MKVYKGVILVLIFTLLLTLGCSPKVLPNFEDMKLEIVSKIISNNNDSYIIRVVVRNHSRTYKFISSAVYIGIHKGDPSNQEPTTAPYLVAGIPSVEGDKNTFIYNINLPKRLLDIEPGVDRQSVDVIARGTWLNSMDKYVSDAYHGIQLYLNDTSQED